MYCIFHVYHMEYSPLYCTQHRMDEMRKLQKTGNAWNEKPCEILSVHFWPVMYSMTRRYYWIGIWMDVMDFLWSNGRAPQNHTSLHSALFPPLCIYLSRFTDEHISVSHTEHWQRAALKRDTPENTSATCFYWEQPQLTGFILQLHDG